MTRLHRLRRDLPASILLTLLRRPVDCALLDRLPVFGRLAEGELGVEGVDVEADGNQRKPRALRAPAAAPTSQRTGAGLPTLAYHPFSMLTRTGPCGSRSRERGACGVVLPLQSRDVAAGPPAARRVLSLPDGRIPP